MIAVWRLRNLRCDADFCGFPWFPRLISDSLSSFTGIVELLLLSATASQLRGDVTIHYVHWFSFFSALCCFQGSLDQSLQNFRATCRSTSLIFKEQAGLLLGREWEEVVVSKCLQTYCFYFVNFAGSIGLAKTQAGHCNDASSQYKITGKHRESGELTWRHELRDFDESHRCHVQAIYYTTSEFKDCWGEVPQSSTGMAIESLLQTGRPDNLLASTFKRTW